MRRILARLMPMLVLVAGLTLVTGPQISAQAATASAHPGAQLLSQGGVWCC